MISGRESPDCGGGGGRQDAAFLSARSSCQFIGGFNWVILTPDFGWRGEAGGAGTEMLSGGIVIISNKKRAHATLRTGAENI